MTPAPADVEKKAEEAAKEEATKAKDARRKEMYSEIDEVQYQRGVEMLDAAIAMEEHVQGPELQEVFRALRAEG